MKTYLDCLPCYLRQALESARFSGVDEETQFKIMKKVLCLLQDFEIDTNPLQGALLAHQAVTECTGISDPYSILKTMSNQMVLDNYSAYQELVHTSPHPLEDAVRLAIAGNVIDFGVSLDFDLTATVQRVRELSFALNDLDALRRELRKPAPLLYITDNAGEIVLDRLLIETILESFGPRRVILLVRSRPFLNDALRADALQAGIDHIHGLELYTLALNLDKSTVIQEIRSFFADSDPDPILLCKGQANYEYLSGIPGFFFLMLVKCTVIAQDLTLQTGITISRGDIISWRN